MKIKIILGSTRDGRIGESIGKWFMNQIKDRKDADYEFIDLKDWAIPLLHASELPSMGEYPDTVVKKWAEKIDEGDGFIFITPEYNHGYSAVLKNALDVIYKEWNNKPVGLIGYGASASGARAVEQLRPVVAELQMTSIRESILLPIFSGIIDENGTINYPSGEKKIEPFMSQLLWWTEALKNARDNKK